MHTCGKIQKTVLCLGFFDSLHLGHVSVIEKAKEIAEEKNATPVVFSFSGNLKKALFSREEKVVLLPSERKKTLKGIGVTHTYFMPVTKKYLSLSKTEFLNFLMQKFNVCAFVFGKDFRFGKNAEGDAEYIKTYAKEKNVKVEVLDILNIGGKKISTTRIKELLKNGKIRLANKLLAKPYFISGRVFKDRGVGTKLGFPTANVKFSTEKAVLKTGVYKGYVKTGAKTYPALINYGYRPTFNQKTLTLEVHLIGFNGDLYKKNITVYFTDFIRKEQKFSSEEELISQIKKDLERIKSND